MLLHDKTLEEFGYSTKDLSEKSDSMVYVQCDYCGEICLKLYRKYNASRKIVSMDCCTNRTCITTKTKQSWNIKYGGHPNSTKTVQDKKKKTTQERYGVDNVFQLDEVKKKTIATNLEKYGVEHPMQNPDILNRANETNVLRYGVERPLQNEELKNKQVQTCIERFGVEIPATMDSIKEQNKQKTFDRYGVCYPAQIHMPEGSVEKLSNRDWLYDQHITQKKCLTKIAIDLGLSATSKTVSDYCKKHNIKIQKHIVSIAEQDIAQFLRENGIQCSTSNRSEISPQELDIFVESKRVGIEFAGLYWHSDIYKDKNYHRNKMISCDKKNIRLITIFEDEWIKHPDIVKTRLLHILKESPNRVYARKCDILKGDYAGFVDKHHIQGNYNATAQYALGYNNEIVAVMTFGRPRFNKDHQWELLRFVSSVPVIGGASKLFNSFLKEYQPNSIVSYCDLRWGTGELYEKLGFKNIGRTQPTYYYTKNTDRWNRLTFTKKRLVELGLGTTNQTEKEIMIQQGYNRIYDCGNLVFSWTSGS